MTARLRAAVTRLTTLAVNCSRCHAYNVPGASTCCNCSASL